MNDIVYRISKKTNKVSVFPFRNAEEAWFWFMQAQQAKDDGARFVSGIGNMPRPCEPVDILKAVDRLYRMRRLLRDHLLVLRHYGLRKYAPDIRRPKEIRAHYLWNEALQRLEEVLARKGIVDASQEKSQPGFYYQHIQKSYEEGAVK